MHRPTGPAPENPAVGRSGVAARGRLILVPVNWDPGRKRAEAARQGPWVNETLHLDVSDLRELAYVRAQPASTAEARSEHAGRRGGTCRRRRFNPHAIAYRYGELPTATLSVNPFPSPELSEPST